MANIYNFPKLNKVNEIPFRTIVHNCKGRASELMYNKTITLDEYREFIKWIDKQKKDKVKPPTSEIVKHILELIGGLN